MQDFILNIIRFLRDIFENILYSVGNYSINQLGLSGDTLKANFKTFLNKPIFLDNSLIGINITYFELLYYVGLIFLLIFFIVLFVKLVFKVIGLICLR